MAIYRPPKPRWPLAVGTCIAGVAVGILIGLLIGRTETPLAESVPAITSTLVSARGSLEVAAIEYAESVRGGEVAKEAEYEGALGAVRSSQEKFNRVRAGLEALAPSRVGPIDDLYAEVQDLMEAKAPATDVAAALSELEALLTGERAAS